MGRTRYQRSQPSRVRQRAIGLRRSLDRVDVEVDRSRVVGIACEHFLQRREKLRGAALGFRAPCLPVIPGLRVHHGLGVEREDRVVGRVLLGHGLHRVGEGRVERGALGLRVRRVAFLESRDQRTILRRRAGRQFDCLGKRGKRRRRRLGHHRRVDVRPEHQRLTPPGHRELRVCLLRGLEGALRLGVVERESPADALVEVGLRLRVARSHLEGQRAQVIVQRYFAARGLHRLWLEGFGLGLREDQLLKQGRVSGRRSAKRPVVEQRIELVFAVNAGGGRERQRADRGKGHCHAQVIRLHGCSFRSAAVERRDGLVTTPYLLRILRLLSSTSGHTELRWQCGVNHGPARRALPPKMTKRLIQR